MAVLLQACALLEDEPGELSEGQGLQVGMFLPPMILQIKIAASTTQCDASTLAEVAWMHVHKAMLADADNALPIARLSPKYCYVAPGIGLREVNLVHEMGFEASRHVR